MRVRYHTILLIAVAAAKSTRFANFKMARMGSAWLADMLLNEPAIGSGGGSSHAPASATELTGEGAIPSKVVGAKRLVQYGIKRSATTLQWVIVEAYVCALGMDGHVEKLHDQAKALSMVKDGVPLFVTHVTPRLSNLKGKPTGASTYVRRVRGFPTKYLARDGADARAPVEAPRGRHRVRAGDRGHLSAGLAHRPGLRQRLRVIGSLDRGAGGR